MNFYQAVVEENTSFTVNGPAVVVYSVPFSAPAGAIVQALANFEVTSNLPYNVGIGCYLLLAPTPLATSGSLLIRPATMMNVTPDIHHLVQDVVGAKQLSSAFTGYLNLVCYAASSAGNGTIIVEPGYGQITALVS